MGFQETSIDWLPLHAEQIVDSIAEGIVSTDANTRIVFFNSGAEAMFGYARDEVLGLPIDLLVPERFRGRHFRHLSMFMAQGEPMRMIGGRGRVTAMRSDYSEFPAEISIARYYLPERAVFTAVVRDISAVALAESQLAESQERYQRLTENIPGVVYERILHRDGRVEYPFMSSGIREFIGVEPDAIIANPSLLLARIHSEDRARYDGALKQSAATLQRLDIEFRHLHSSGEVRWIHTVSKPWKRASDGAIVWEAMAFDTTAAHAASERTDQLERKLRQAEKMEMIATLASGVAHEFNNLMHPICATADMMLSKLGAQSPDYAKLKRISAAAWQASGISRKILAAGRAARSGFEPVDLLTVANEAAEFVRPSLGASLTLALMHDGASLVVSGSRSQLVEVALNLMCNARDAMASKGGTIEVSLSRVDVGETVPATRVGVLKPGPYAVLTVEDSGTGMDEATMERIFDPFFTTKPIGKGTGLGLSITNDAVGTHGGAIGLESTQGAGTRFSIYLPAE